MFESLVSVLYPRSVNCTVRATVWVKIVSPREKLSITLINAPKNSVDILCPT